MMTNTIQRDAAPARQSAALEWSDQVLVRAKFAGADLAGANFSGAQLAGAHFAGANLRGANFSGCRCGLDRRWMALLAVGMVLALLFSGIVIGYSGALLAFTLVPTAEELTGYDQLILSILGVALFAGLVILLLHKGLGIVLVTFAALTALTVAALALATIVPDAGLAALVLLLLGIGAPIAGIVLLAAGMMLAHNMAGPRAWFALLALAAAATVYGVWEGVQGLSSEEVPLAPNVLIPSLAIATLAAVAFFTISLRIDRLSASGDVRYTLLRKAVIGLISRGGTSFRGADLTEASFAGADLVHTDLRGARLLRTNWKNASRLDRARTDQSYLDQPAVRQLVTTHDGQDARLEQQTLEGLYLAGANLRQARLTDANLSKTDLRGADLTGARLAKARLYETDLTGAVLTGAYIEEWGVSTETRFDRVDCRYVYMRLPTLENPNPWRKPDQDEEFFAPGDFSRFMTPLLDILHLYSNRKTDPRELGAAVRTLDLFHHESIDPVVAALALQQLAERHPNVDLELAALASRGSQGMRLHALVSAAADSAALSAEYHALYRDIQALPAASLQWLREQLGPAEARVTQLELLLHAASQSPAAFVQANVRLESHVQCLFIAANPLDLPRLKLETEFRTITQALAQSKHGHLFQVIPILDAHDSDLVRALGLYQPQIVHISGHGTAGGEIVLVDEQGMANPVPADVVARLFSAHQQRCRLLLLNSCYGERQAAQLGGASDCTIGMSERISDDAAIRFIGAFYGAIGNGLSVQQSFEQAVAFLALKEGSEVDRPQLLAATVGAAASLLFVNPPTAGKTDV